MPASSSLQELFEACHAGNLNKLKTLLQEWTVEGYGLPRNNDDVGLVELASEHGYVDIVRYLLENCHTYVTASMVGGWTALHAAAHNGHTEIVKLLLRHGAEPRVKEDYVGGTALHAAVATGQLDAARILLEYGALRGEKLVNDTERNGSTALHLAASEDFVELATLLIEFGADVHAANVTGERPLHHACMNGARGTAEVLVRHGADLTVPDRAHKTPRDYNVRLGDLLKPLVEQVRAATKEERERDNPRTSSGSGGDHASHITIDHTVRERGSTRFMGAVPTPAPTLDVVVDLGHRAGDVVVAADPGPKGNHNGSGGSGGSGINDHRAKKARTS